MKKLVLAAVLFATTGSAAFAGGTDCIQILWWSFCPPAPVQHTSKPVSAPEIDPASALAGLALMAGGLAVLRGRRSKA